MYNLIQCIYIYIYVCVYVCVYAHNTGTKYQAAAARPGPTAGRLAFRICVYVYVYGSLTANLAVVIKFA